MRKFFIAISALALLGACAETIEWSDEFCKHCKEEFASPPSKSVSPN